MTALYNLLRQTYNKQLRDAFSKVLGSTDSDRKKIEWCLRFINAKKKSKFGCDSPQLNLPLNLLNKCGVFPSDLSYSKQKKLYEDIANHCVQSSEGLVTISENLINLRVPNTHLSQAVLGDILSDSNYGNKSPWHNFIRSPGSHSTFTEARYGQTVGVEFSSPNIAKPFHAGHLRSTVIGNTIANINSFLGNNTIKINYLGDWGTQFGLLYTGFKDHGSMEDLEQNPVKHLFDVYVAANKVVAADESGGYHRQAMHVFKQMEEGDKNVLTFWEKCRNYSIEEYKGLYKRLGVTFDIYQSEAMFCEKAKEAVEMMRNKGLLQVQEGSDVSSIDLTLPTDKEKFNAVLLKGDGTTLYITRDIAAAMDRYEQLKFDRLHYVVGSEQHRHFKQLLRTLQRLQHPWASSICIDDLHVMFGRVQGMSTRRGNVVLLSDILDEAQQRMKTVMMETSTTRVSGQELDLTAEKLGVCAVVIGDLSHWRKTNYTFSWEDVLRFTGDTGVYLQYTYARLSSIIEKCGIDMSDVKESLFDPSSNLVSHLHEPEAVRVIQQLARYSEAVHMAYIDMEPCHLIQYLFTLGRATNVAFTELFVRGQPEEIAKARLAMFDACRQVLASGLKLAGIEPLVKI